MSKLRRTMMYVPGNNPSMMIDAGIYGADSVMFDLEDAVAASEKDSARCLVYEALKHVNLLGTESVVRINGLDSPHGIKDIEAAVRGGVNVIRLPKTDSAAEIHELIRVLDHIEKTCNKSLGTTKIMAAIEGPLGIINAFEIATASDRMIGIAIGAEDFVTNMKTTRSREGLELLQARSQLVLAARAAGIAALDTVFSNLDDMEGFEEEVKTIKQLGFDGKSVINPRQIEVVHKIYAPRQDEIENAVSIMRAIEDANKRGLGVVSLNGKMIDKPIVERAERILALARMEGVGL